MTKMQRIIWATALLSLAKANVIINEIADKGTSDVCNGEDWIELYNGGATEVNLGAENYVLHDDKGMLSSDVFIFPQNTILAAQDYLVLCTGQKLSSEESDIEILDPMSPQFGIGGGDTITLLRVQTIGNATLAPGTVFSTARNGDTYEVVSVVALPNTDDDFDVTYSLNIETGEYNYTSTPTPGAPNVITPVLTQEEKNAQWKEELKAQSDEGIQFFNMDDAGLPVADGMEDVVDLLFTMEEADYAYMMANETYEMYRPFQSGVLAKTDGTVISTIDTPGRIRPKGQSTLFMSACTGTETFPLQVELGDGETFYGMEKFFLRNHMGDFSYNRDWAYNRMLARFGLPFLRTRKARVYVNGNLHGFYTVMEAPDQDYVFHRNFPDFDPQSYALYKVKSYSFDCGIYTHEEIAIAEARMDETSTPPYAFQRGEHKTPVEELGMMGTDQCIDNYNEQLWEHDYIDVILAWLRYDKSCEDMIMGEDLIDRDLGTKDYNKEMREFITKDYSQEQKCDEGCTNTDLKERVDTENWLKSFAFYAVTANSDSPLINGNNFYLAQSGAENSGGVGGWKFVPYDFNLPNVVYCHDDLCNSRLAHWSIARPTCTSLEQNNLAGPLLTDETLHARYLEYVREFTETVYANEEFIEQIQAHAAAQKEYVLPDFWSFFGAFYDKELTPDSAKWDEEDDRFPLLPFMKARAEDVRAQLKAIDEATYPRGPFVGINGDNEPLEACPDWRSEEADQSACPGGCNYRGCEQPDWTIPSYCDEEKGICVHGDYDERCRGVEDEFGYIGIEDTPDGRKTWCRYTKGVPVKVAECPAVGAFLEDAAESSGVRASFVFSALIALVAVLVH